MISFLTCLSLVNLPTGTVYPYIWQLVTGTEVICWTLVLSYTELSRRPCRGQEVHTEERLLWRQFCKC